MADSFKKYGKLARPKTGKKPQLTIKRFPNLMSAEDYAGETQEKLGTKYFEIAHPKVKKGVTLIKGVDRPAVLVVSPVKTTKQGKKKRTLKK